MSKLLLPIDQALNRRDHPRTQCAHAQLDAQKCSPGGKAASHETP